MRRFVLPDSNHYVLFSFRYLYKMCETSFVKFPDLHILVVSLVELYNSSSGIVYKLSSVGIKLSFIGTLLALL